MILYYLESNSNWHNLDTQLLDHVSEQRKNKILSYRFPEDQKLSLYSALIIRMVLSKIIGISATELTFESLPNHKPQLFSPSGYDFSFSHTHHFILCGIATYGAIGVDVEKIVPAPFEIMPMVFHPMEIEYVNHSSENEINLKFFQIWTQKEAYTKYLGTGLIKNLTLINTLDESLSHHFYTWQEGNYICTAYSDFPLTNSPIKLTEEMIQTYFLGL